MPEFNISRPLLEQIVREALDEDVGVGDLTTLCTVPAAAQARAVFLCKSPGVVAGTHVASEVFRQVDEDVRVSWRLSDGTGILAGETLAEVSGAARGILTGERVALNFLQQL